MQSKRCYPTELVRSTLTWFITFTGAIAQPTQPPPPTSWHTAFEQQESLSPYLKQKKIVSLNVEQTDDGGCVVAATSFLPKGFSPYVVKLAESGSVSWHQPLASGTLLCQVKQTTDGHYLAVGDVFNYNSQSIFISRLTRSGRVISQDQLPFESGVDLNCQLLLSSTNGSFLLVGIRSPAVRQAAGLARSNLFLAKLTKEGRLLWTKTIKSRSVVLLNGGQANKTGFVLSVSANEPALSGKPVPNKLTPWNLHVSEAGDFIWQPAATTAAGDHYTMPYVNAGYRISTFKNRFDQDWHKTGDRNTTHVVRQDAEGTTFLCGTTDPTGTTTDAATASIWVRKLATIPLRITQRFDCPAGRLRVHHTGGTEEAVTYQIPGIRGWSADSVFLLQDYQRMGKSLVVEARQGAKTVSVPVTTAPCQLADLLAGGTPETPAWRVSLSENPVAEFARLTIQGVADETIAIQVSTLSGHEIRRVQLIGTGSVQPLSVNLTRYPAGIYLIRVSHHQQVQELKVIKQ